MATARGQLCSRSVPVSKNFTVGPTLLPSRLTTHLRSPSLKVGQPGVRPHRGVGDLVANPPQPRREREVDLPITPPAPAPRRRGADPAALPPEAKLRPGDRRRYRLCNPPPARYPEGADVVKVLVTRRGGRIKRLVLGSWPVSVPVEARCVLPPWPRRAVYGAAASGWARAQLRASRQPGGKRLGWSTERNLRKVAHGERPLMVDLWNRVRAWLSPPPLRPAPLVPLRVNLFGGRPAIVRGPAEPASLQPTPASPAHPRCCSHPRR